MSESTPKPKLAEGQTAPFPQNKWTGLQYRMTKAAREFTKRWKKDRSGYRVDGDAVCLLGVTLFMRGNGELVGYTSPKVVGLEPRYHDWVKELDLDGLANKDIAVEEVS